MLKFTDCLYISIIIFVYYSCKWGFRFIIIHQIGKTIEDKTKEVKELFKRGEDKK